MIDFSNMTPAQIRIKKGQLEKELVKYYGDEHEAEYAKVKNEINQCLCVLHKDAHLAYLGLDRKQVMEEAMRLAILDDIGVSPEELEITESSLSFTVQTWQSVNAFVKKLQHVADIEIKSVNTGSINKGGYYKITAYISQSYGLAA